MTSENYLNHPNFGLLFRLCLGEDSRELFTTLYAQRLFFVTTSTSTAPGFQFEPLNRNDARLFVENQLRHLRRNGQLSEYSQLQKIHKDTFQ
jgi:PII interaction protein X